MNPTESEEKFPVIPASLRGKKIVLVNHSDTLGGAAVVTFRLMQSMKKAGLDVSMLVYTKTSDNPGVRDVGTRFTRGMRFCAERLRILANNGFNYDSLFKVSTGDFAHDITDYKVVREADIVCLNWINQGLMSLGSLRKLKAMGKHIVWTMHDMWCMTGICHHAYDCANYERECGDCPFLAGGGNPGDLSHKIWKRKRAVYADVPVKFVAVSHWLEQCARRSSLLGDADVRTIPNAFPVDDFITRTTRRIPSIDIYQKPNVIVFGAARIDDPIKGVEYTIEALNYIFDNYPELASHSVALFFGAVRNHDIFDNLRFSHHHLGRINDFKILRHLYATAKVVVSTSLFETLPGTLIEGQAGGAIPVTFDHGGQADIVTHMKDGYIAEYLNPESVAKGIMWALQADVSREELHESVRRRFSAQQVVGQYMKLFEEFYN